MPKIRKIKDEDEDTTESDSNSAKIDKGDKIRDIKDKDEDTTESDSNSAKIDMADRSYKRKRDEVVTPSQANKKFKSDPLALQRENWTRAVWQPVSKKIWDFYVEIRQRQETLNSKSDLHNRLYAFMKTIFSDLTLFMVGSTMTGLASNSSDLDLTLVVDPFQEDRAMGLKTLILLTNYVNTCPSFTNIQVIRQARCPILKLKDIKTSFSVDISVNNLTAIKNTKLMQFYCRADWRVAPLVLTVKTWAELHGIKDARTNTLSSYALVLMIIAYLQDACQPPVLPCLQLGPKEFREKLSGLVGNQDNLGQLFLGFLNYYGNVFDFQKDALSVRSGRKIRRSDNDVNNYMFVEEPYNLSNTAKSVNSYENFMRIISVFRNSYDTFSKFKTLSSILTPY